MYICLHILILVLVRFYVFFLGGGLEAGFRVFGGGFGLGRGKQTQCFRGLGLEEVSHVSRLDGFKVRGLGFRV